MPKYLVKASYTAEGVKGLLKDGGVKRRRALEQLMQSLGGRVEAFYFSFGEADVVSIIEAPDNVSAVSVSVAVNASGAVTTTTTPLITPEEMDQATKKSVAYHPPGE